MVSEYVKFAHELAEASGEVINKYFRSNLEIEDKSDKSPVTVADRLAESVLRKMISEKYPDHDILGEEYGYESSGSRWKWVLDPIDGTKAFITGNPLFGTLIGLMYKGEPMMGVIHAPATGERWAAEKGFECSYQDRENSKSICKTSKKTKLSETFCTALIPRCSMKHKLLACIKFKPRLKIRGLEETAIFTGCLHQAGLIWSSKQT